MRLYIVCKELGDDLPPEVEQTAYRTLEEAKRSRPLVAEWVDLPTGSDGYECGQLYTILPVESVDPPIVTTREKLPHVVAGLKARAREGMMLNPPKSPEEAQRHRYGAWAGRPKGTGVRPGALRLRAERRPRVVPPVRLPPRQGSSQAVLRHPRPRHRTPRGPEVIAVIVDVTWPSGETRRARLEDFFSDNRHLVWGNQHAYVSDLRRDGETRCCGATLRVVRRSRPDCEAPSCGLMQAPGEDQWCDHHRWQLTHEIVRGDPALGIVHGPRRITAREGKR